MIIPKKRYCVVIRLYYWMQICHAALRPGCVVSVEDMPNIFASTCMIELKLPLHFSDSAQFDACLNGVLGSSSFPTV